MLASGDRVGPMIEEDIVPICPPNSDDLFKASFFMSKVGEGVKDRIGKSGEEMTHQTRGYPGKRTLGTERMFHVETRRTLRNPEKL